MPHYLWYSYIEVYSTVSASALMMMSSMNIIILQIIYCKRKLTFLLR